MVFFSFFYAAVHHNGLSMNQALLGLSPNIVPGPKEGDLAHDMSHEAKRMHADKGESSLVLFSSMYILPIHNKSRFKALYIVHN